MSDSLHSSSAPPPKWNRWVIYAAIGSIFAIIVLMFQTPDPDAVAPDGALGTNKQDN
ncbi:MAG: hypothetical protein HQ504_06570 [Rhodospirillaceae bacterium]|nr:hypothetical protein [Rhodospirillaceae bacterium]